MAHENMKSKELPFDLDDYPWEKIERYYGNYGVVEDVAFEIKEYLMVRSDAKVSCWFILLEAIVVGGGNDAILQKTAALESNKDGSFTIYEGQHILENAGGGGPYDYIMDNLILGREGKLVAQLPNHPEIGKTTFDWQSHLSYSHERKHYSEIEKFYKKDDFNSTCGLLIPAFDQVNRELLEHFGAHPERLQNLDWRKFEELLEAIFRNQGFRTELGPGRGDRGVDLRLIQNDSIGSILTLVQAKRYKSSNPIGLEPVSALYGTVEMEGANRGLFVTTSRYLPGAQRFARSTGNRLVLANSMDVARWCRSVLNE